MGAKSRPAVEVASLTLTGVFACARSGVGALNTMNKNAQKAKCLVGRFTRASPEPITATNSTKANN
jgi:hypothetical protein